MDYKKLGSRIKEYRLNTGMTQEKLAEAVDLSAVYISQIEHGQRKLSLESLVRIADALNATVDTLLVDSLNIEDEDVLIDQLKSLLGNRTQEEKSLVMEVVKTVLRNMKKNGL